ncbi:MAG: hypothetical protein O3B01_08000 [Planctomycetota bacterium]|nr:hypothetical protein [Planctomycetota bacterium]
MRSLLLILSFLLAGTAFIDAEEPAPLRMFVAHELVQKDGKLDPEIPKEIRRLMEVIEDDATESGKAFKVRVDKRMVRKGAIPFLKTPAIPRTENGAPGVYRVSARLKIEGMLNVIGTPIGFGPRSNWGESTRLKTKIYGYQFEEEDKYQEFSFLLEIIEPDMVSKRPSLPSPTGALGQSPWGLSHLKAQNAAFLAPGLDVNKEKVLYDHKVSGFVRKPYGWSAVHETASDDTWRKGADLAIEMEFPLTSPKGESMFGFDGIANTLQSVTVDWIKVERVEPDSAATVRQVLPRKLWIRPGDTQEFIVWMHNRSGKPQTGNLVLSIENGLNVRKQIASKEVTIANGDYRLDSILWEIPKDHPMWGARVIASFDQEGGSRSSADEVFSIHPNPWGVMNFGGNHRSNNPYYEPPSYRNYVESFGVKASDSVQPMPDDPSVPYITGMSGYATLIALQKEMADWNRYIGRSSFMYLSPLATSHRAELNYLKHPEWYQDRISWTDQAHDMWVNAENGLIDAWKNDKPGPVIPDLFHIETSLNFNYESLVQRTIEGSLSSIDMVGWDGIRGDGLPLALAGMNSLGHATGPEDGMERKKQSAALLRRMRETIRKKHPNFVWGSNGDLYGVGNVLTDRRNAIPDINNSPAFVAMFEGGNLEGGNYMDEGWMNAYMYLDTRNVIRNYLYICRRQADFTRKAGGFFHTFSPQRDGTGYFVQSDIYYNLLTILAGAQYPGKYSNTPGSETGSAHFITRFSEFLWDIDLKWLENGAEVIRVDTDEEVWFEDTVVWKDLPDGRRRYVIPIINPPTMERFYKDRFSEVAEPIKEPFEVEVKTPEGFSDADVWMLTAEPRTAAVKLEAEADDAAVVFKVPELIIYRVIVIEFKK